MTLKPYTPQAGSLASNVVGFFINNRDEHLTLDDITYKFDCSRGNIHTLLRAAMESGLLKRAKDADGDYIYQRGPDLPTAAQAPLRADVLNAPAPAPKSARTIRKYVDIAALQVDDDVPYMPESARGGSKWDALFNRLTKVNQSVPIPGDCKAAVAAAALKRNKKGSGTYRVAMTTRTEARVWRVA